MAVMHLRLASIFAAALFSALPAFAQGTKADYERALSLAKRTDSKVFRTKVTPH